MPQRRKFIAITVLILSLAACETGGLRPSKDSPYAPSVNPRGKAVDGLTVGHRLLASNEPELALEAFNRAALEQGLNVEVLSAMGSANLALGRMNQAETLFRRAIKKDPKWPELWNNLGVVLMNLGRVPEAANTFKQAYALDNGKSDAIRDNLRLALANQQKSVYDPSPEQDYKLVRLGSSEYLIKSAN